jgi:hypothetical protein
MVFPYLNGLVIILLFYICCGDFVFSIQVLKNWYQIIFLGWSCGQLFFIFADLFFSEKKKRGPRHSRHFQYISVKKMQKGLYI